MVHLTQQRSFRRLTTSSRLGNDANYLMTVNTGSYTSPIGRRNYGYWRGSVPGWWRVVGSTSI